MRGLRLERRVRLLTPAVVAGAGAVVLLTAGTLFLVTEVVNRAPATPVAAAQPVAEPAARAAAEGRKRLGAILAAEGPDLDRLRVMAVTEGGPAADAGLAAGDLLEAIDGRPVAGRTLDEIHGLFRAPDRLHRLRVIRDGEAHELELRTSRPQL